MLSSSSAQVVLNSKQANYVASSWTKFEFYNNQLKNACYAHIYFVFNILKNVCSSVIFHDCTVFDPDFTHSEYM